MDHTILFTGHMIDRPGRNPPRFPAGKEKAAKEKIMVLLKELVETIHDNIVGIAGGAAGGDILFLEACMELHIRAELFLALPSTHFKSTSVSYAGSNWESRFDRLLETFPARVLSEHLPGENVWEAANFWMMQEALKNGSKNMTLIALWDGEKGEGAGGTQHMVETADQQGAKTLIIDTASL